MHWTYFVATLVCYILLNGGNNARAQGPPPTDPPPSFNDTANWQAAFAMFNNSATSRSGDKNLTVFDRIFKANALARGKAAARSDNVFLFEADIHLTQAQLQELVKSEKSRTKRAILKKTSRNLWKKNQIAYSFASSITSYVRKRIQGAIGEWHATLDCMGAWRLTTPSDSRDQMMFFRGGGCYSMVGRQGRRQQISIGRGCEVHGIIVHEIGHAMGFWHEQSRPDRDGYVRIIWGNIRRGMEYNFRKKTSQHVDSLGIPYDYSSVMHYGATAFANRPGARTIVATRGDRDRTLGQRNGLSVRDKLQAKRLYRCDTTTIKPVCTDQKKHCRAWKNSGYCSPTSKYGAFMAKNCCKTCSSKKTKKVVKPPCVDRDRRCIWWKSHCASNSYVIRNCKKRCGSCS